MGIIETVSDLSYAWEIINDFMSILHTRVKKDPSCVILLRVSFHGDVISLIVSLGSVFKIGINFGCSIDSHLPVQFY